MILLSLFQRQRGGETTMKTLQKAIKVRDNWFCHQVLCTPDTDLGQSYHSCITHLGFLMPLRTLDLIILAYLLSTKTTKLPKGQMSKLRPLYPKGLNQCDLIFILSLECVSLFSSVVLRLLGREEDYKVQLSSSLAWTALKTALWNRKRQDSGEHINIL